MKNRSTTVPSNQKKPGLSDNSAAAGNVKVVCRFRPLNQKELAMGDAFCCEFLDEQTVTIKNREHDNNPDKTKYFFDRVFPMASEQDQIYDFAAKPVIESVLEGFNGTVFAYGQTSSGKTHTMQGPDIDNPKLKGIIPRMVTTVFDAIGSSPDYIEFRLKVALVEIYMERIRDLLDITKTDLKIREDKNRGIYIQDVTETYVSEENEIYNLMRIGTSNRAISATQMNEGSSRSHSLFMLTISQNNLNDLSAKTGKLFLVDLAGSEKIGKTGASGQTLDEAKKINKSLSSLGNVINALTDGKSSHIPYRDSKLTRILQESLGGNARTTLIITCSPSPYNEAETISTLRFGVRAKSIKNKPKINRELTVAELQILLAKAEKTIEEKEMRIRQLEEYIKNLGNTVPEQANIIAEKEEDEGKDDYDFTTEESKPETNEKINESSLDISIIKSKNDEIDGLLERIRNLEKELEFERNNVKSQTEKLNGLKKDFTLLNAKSLTQEKENEALIHKLAELTMSLQGNEELVKEKDDKIEQLEELKQTFIAEIDSLKQSKNNLIQTLEEKNREIENRLETNVVSDLGMRRSSSHLDREKILEYNLNKEIILELEKALAIEKDNAVRNLKKYEEMREQYQKLCEEKVPQIDDIRRNLFEILKEEDKNLGKQIIPEEIKEKLEELTRKTHEIELEREKNVMLENYLMQTKKILRKKIISFENNIEQITHSYHQLVSQRSVLKVDNQALEKQILRKNERITQLEKLLSEAKEQQSVQKLKYDTLKAMVCQNELGNSMYAGAFDMSSPSISKKFKGITEKRSLDEEKLDTIEESLRNSENKGTSNTSKKIVKHIRGGQGKSSLSSNQFINKTLSSE